MVVWAKCLENDLRELQSESNIFDFSNYPEGHPLHDRTHKNALGRWKHETPCHTIVSGVALKPKCYSFICEPTAFAGSEKTVTTCKGVKKSAAPMFHQYRRALFAGTKEFASFHTFQVRDYQVQTVHQRKLALTNLETKRWYY